jgi:hypothetical protein
LGDACRRCVTLVIRREASELSPEIGDGENREGGSHDARNSAAIQLKVSAEDFATLAPTVVAQDYSRFE